MKRIKFNRRLIITAPGLLVEAEAEDTKSGPSIVSVTSAAPTIDNARSQSRRTSVVASISNFLGLGPKTQSVNHLSIFGPIKPHSKVLTNEYYFENVTTVIVLQCFFRRIL